MTKESKKFLTEYLNAASASGFEVELGGQKIWVDQITPFCDKVELDDYGNAYAHYNSNSHGYYSEGHGFIKNKNVKTVLLDAHADEIGFVISDITKDGFVKVNRLGGSDVNITPSTRVNLWGELGAVKGVFGHPAIHIQNGEFTAEIHKLFIDLGVSSKEEVLKLGLKVGAPITMEGDYMELGEYHCGRSLDDKIGGFITAQLLQILHENNVELPFELVVVNAVQEEVGLFGAKMAAQRIKPDVAIAIDVTHDTMSPAYDKNKQGTLVAGEGVVLLNGPSIQKNVFKLLENTAINAEIPYQIVTSGRGSGTNADSYAYPAGIPTGLLKMAMRYMHTTVETVHKNDVDSAINLLYELMQTKEINESFKYKL